MWAKGVVTLAMVLGVGRRMWRRCRLRPEAAETRATAALPPPQPHSPVVLVCGDGLDDLFAGQSLRKTGQGCWLRVDDVDALTDTVRAIQAQRPRQLGQLSIMYACLPDRHQDEAMLRASFSALRQQAAQLKSLTGFSLPLVLNCQFSGPATPWNIIRGDSAAVCPVDEAPVALRQWQQAALPVLQQAFSFIREILLHELETTDRLCPPAHPFAVTLRIGAPTVNLRSLWARWLCRRTRLELPQTPARPEADHHFPDALLPLLSPLALPVQRGQAARRLLCLLLACVLGAIGFAVANNRNLIRQVATELQRWHAIPMAHVVPKAQSLATLKQTALLLERWQRQGEPLKYGLGLYTGQRLWLALQQAIDTYVPPPPTSAAPTPFPVASAQTVRLDALSLFGSGKHQLKPDSTRRLVNALIGIKARPGWLIVVAGHTDSTGDADANHKLSLKRAEALRDWMLSTSDVSPTCFAVQGYGATRPIATNDTPAGRAANRRVEISLMLQANACQATTSQHAATD